MSLLEKANERWTAQCQQYEKDNVPVPKDRIRWASVAKAMQTEDKDALAQFIRRDILKELPDATQSINADICDDCGVQMVVIANDSMLACMRCGKTRNISTVHAWNSSMDADFTALNTHQKSRLLEWLEYAQAKEYGDISENTLNEAMSIIVRHKMSGLEQYTDEIRMEFLARGPFTSVSNAVERLSHQIPNLELLLKGIDSIFIRNVLKSCIDSKSILNDRRK
jgi:hypothetical protein